MTPWRPRSFSGDCTDLFSVPVNGQQVSARAPSRQEGQRRPLLWYASITSAGIRPRSLTS